MIGYFTIIVFRGPQGEASQPCTFSARSPLADFFLEFMSSYLITKQELQPLADVIAEAYAHGAEVYAHCAEVYAHCAEAYANG